MAFTVISAKYPPQIDPTRVPLAYGDRALPKLNRELQVMPTHAIGSKGPVSKGHALSRLTKT